MLHHAIVGRDGRAAPHSSSTACFDGVIPKYPTDRKASLDQSDAGIARGNSEISGRPKGQPLYQSDGGAGVVTTVIGPLEIAPPPAHGYVGGGCMMLSTRY